MLNKKVATPNKNFLNRQNGVIFLWVSFGLMVLFSISAVVIETSSKSLVKEQLQQAVDATALAAAKELNGNQSGWLNVKRVAAATFLAQRIEGSKRSDNSVEVSFSDGGKIDILETDENFKDIEASLGQVNLRVERGIYWAAGENGKMEFFSLEGLNSSNVTDSQGKELPLSYSLPSYLMANAVKITGEVSGIRKVFGSLFGTSETQGTNASSAIAISDTKQEECVLPAAIPACALMLNTDINENKNYLTDYYKASNQCQRELVIAEADPEGIKNYSSRAYGIMRSELYPAYPRLSGGIPNRKAIPIWGVLGTADTNAQTNEAANNSDIINILNSEQKCQFVRLGTRFKPVENAAGGGGLFTTRGTELTNILEDILNKEKIALNTFAKAFVNGGKDPFDPTVPSTDLKPNYPFLNYYENEDDDLNELYKEYRMSNGKTFRIKLEKPSHPHNWTNPMCHNYNSNKNDPNSGVKDVKIMVIAPTTVDNNGYCDFNAVFGGTQANTTAPIADTNPRVVGFVSAKLFDFNVKSYNSPTSKSPDENFDKSPNFYSLINTEDVDIDNNVVEDGNLSLEEIKDSATDFTTQHKEWQECQAKPKCKTGQNPSTHNCRINNCGGKPELKEVQTSFGAMFSEIADCVEIPEINDIIPDFSEMSESEIAENKICKSYKAEDRTNVLCRELPTVNDICQATGTSDFECLWNFCKQSSDNMLQEFSAIDFLEKIRNNEILDEDPRNLVDLINQSWKNIGLGINERNSDFYKNEINYLEDLKDLGYAYDEQDLKGGCDEDMSECLPTLEEELNEVTTDMFEDLVKDKEGFGDIREISQKFSKAQFEASCQVMDEYLKKLGNTKIPRPYCLPTRKTSCTDSQSQGCFEDIKPRDPQYGCGGLRLRLDCEQQPNLGVTIPENIDKMPALVR